MKVAQAQPKLCDLLGTSASALAISSTPRPRLAFTRGGTETHTSTMAHRENQSFALSRSSLSAISGADSCTLPAAEPGAASESSWASRVKTMCTTIVMKASSNAHDASTCHPTELLSTRVASCHSSASVRGLQGSAFCGQGSLDDWSYRSSLSYEPLLRRSWWPERFCSGEPSRRERFCSGDCVRRDWLRSGERARRS
jgi:hypothetical protein